MRMVLVLGGGAGFLILARALLGSSGSGSGAGGAFSSVLFAVLALALAAGLLELWIRQRRSESGQLEVIQSILNRSEALPVAVSSLETVSEQLRELQDSWVQAHERSTQATLEIIRGAVMGFRGDMKQAVEDSGRIAKEAITPLFEDAIERTTAAASVHLGEVVECVARDFDARRVAEAEHASRLSGLLEAQARQLTEQLGVEGEARREAEARHLELLANQAGALAKSEEERHTQLGSQWRDLTARLSETMNSAARRDLEFDRRLQEVTEQQLDALQRVAALTEERGATLADTLTAHGDRLAGRLETSETLVAEAAALVKAGGAEMAGVAEMFGHAVDRQREAASAWLDSLGEVESALGGAVEDAVDRAGRGAAADALRSQLASTEELFARQLQFQRELFTQLRSLRTGDGDVELVSRSAEPEEEVVDDEADVLHASDTEAGTPAGVVGA